MNEVDRQVAELQAQSGEKKKAEYSVEVESEDIATPTEENEIEIPQENKTFQAEVDDTQEEPVVEDKSKQEEVKVEEEQKGDSKQNYSKSVQKRFDEYAYQLGESRRREEEAIKIANDTSYGLTNYIQTQDSEKVQRVARKLRSGMVDVNGAGIAVDAPFGGFKHSGIGREAGEHGLEEFLEVKAVGCWS